MAELIRFSVRDEQARRLQESMRRVLGEFYQYLEQDDVIEISLNPNGWVWIDRLGQPMQCAGGHRQVGREQAWWEPNWSGKRAG
jgi:Flp pilus assembly CpaF family ATPase